VARQRVQQPPVVDVPDAGGEVVGRSQEERAGGVELDGRDGGVAARQRAPALALRCSFIRQKKRNNQSKQKSQSTDDRRRELEEEISIDDEGTRGTEIANISPWVSDGIIVE